VLVIHSNDDVVAKPSEQQRLRHAYPQAAWREFAGAGHSAYSMTPYEYADVVAAFAMTASRSE
jgi:pimeloyl-ACP methyl ester carboxylesterase